MCHGVCHQKVHFKAFIPDNRNNKTLPFKVKTHTMTRFPDIMCLSGFIPVFFVNWVWIWGCCLTINVLYREPVTPESDKRQFLPCHAVCYQMVHGGANYANNWFNTIPLIQAKISSIISFPDLMCFYGDFHPLSWIIIAGCCRHPLHFTQKCSHFGVKPNMDDAVLRLREKKVKSNRICDKI